MYRKTTTLASLMLTVGFRVESDLCSIGGNGANRRASAFGKSMVEHLSRASEQRR